MFEVANFADKLSEQMLQYPVSVKQLSENINVSYSTIYNFLKGRYKQPNTEIFFRLIEYFQCSADYMLGLVEFPVECVTYYPPLRLYGQRIKELLKARKTTQLQFIEDLHISSNLAYTWLSDKALPTIEYLIKLSHYFDMSVDMFIQRVK